jgi:2-polyprenyl-3-methyl-5-hydroxy-6-metoxy-1,4-benzoquinol methylase
MNEMETPFEEIYLENKWLYGSGEGSLPEHTGGYVSVLQKFLRKHCIKTVVDMGCGDWQFSKLIDWSGITYDGFDIVSSVIGENQKRFSSNTVQFHLYSGNPGELPAADLLIAKDVLQHLSDGAVKAFLPELKDTNTRLSPIV